MASATGANVVIVDALRASSTICALFQAGAAEVLVCDGVASARKVAAEVEGSLLAGEEDSKKPEGFILGNSPADALEANLEGKSVVFTSTNGARLLVACKNAGRVLIGSVNNVECVGRRVNTSNNSETIIIPAGDMEEQADEDDVSAALISQACGPEIDETQEAVILYWLSRIADEGLATLFEESLHGKELIELQREKDVELASKPDIFQVTPEVEEYLDFKGEVAARLRIGV